MKYGVFNIEVVVRPIVPNWFGTNPSVGNSSDAVLPKKNSANPSLKLGD